MRPCIKLTALVLAIALAGCTVAPIHNVSEAAAVSTSGKPLSTEQVRSAIVRAGSSLGWQMKDEGPNMLVGSIMLRTHSAVVEIPYSANSYSVKYRSSTNLNESNGNIHKNYNGWIQNLDRSIRASLSTH
jgi:hypothetical protein